MKLKVGNITKIRTGKLDANASSPDGKYPFFTCSKNPLKISTYSYDCECVLVAGNGDLNVKYYNGKFDAYQRTYIIEDNSNGLLYMPYLYYFFEGYIEKLRKQSIGGVIKYIKLGNLTNALIELPSIEEQKYIVSLINISSELIDLRRETINKLDSLVKARFIEMFGDPVSNSKHLPLKTLPQLGTFGRGVSKYRPRNAPELLNGPYPLIQTGDIANSELYIKNYNSTYSEVGLKQSKMWDKGTLCITIAANIAKTAILQFDACFPDSVVGFNGNNFTNNIFIYYWFSFFQEILENQAPESAQKNINLKILSELQIITPDIIEQNKFVHFVRHVDKSRFDIKKSIIELEREVVYD
ncbi:restriction endonuclease subunit S [uncultured Holdemanella sp.]|uniref:restriction endonuclease subunit S n=1 Tax=uncultured Holdemanella sp. TaxID=1763549 RepID=UPI00258936F0|nr:restriction endonuclease subunit S [uncultured Holdemanella sp.]